ncbi:MAG: Holliday junction resolvase RuvX [Bacillota bacterium]
MRILGLDLGDKTIGVAVSDPSGLIAQGVTVIRRRDEAGDLKKIKELLRKYPARLIVVGLPRNMNGTLGEQGQKAVAFAEKLKRATGLPVQTWDERLTTLAAEKVLISADLTRARRKKVIDKIAAALILQNFLDAKEVKNIDKGGPVKLE